MVTEAPIQRLRLGHPGAHRQNHRLRHYPADEKAASHDSHDNSVESSTSSHDDGSPLSSKERSISSHSLEPPPELSSITVYLSDPPDGLNTRWSKVVYMTVSLDISMYSVTNGL